MIKRVQSLNLGNVSQACLDLGFFYLVNHGVEEELLKKVFEQSKKFFSLPVEEKIKFAVKNHRGYTGLYDEKLDTSLNAKGIVILSLSFSSFLFKFCSTLMATKWVWGTRE